MQRQADGLAGDAGDDISDPDTTTSTNRIDTPADHTFQAASNGDVDSQLNTHALALDMQQRCKLLLDELELFRAYLKEHGKENEVELRSFKTDLQSEMSFIDKLAKNPSKAKSVHSLRSSNFSFFVAVWSIAKTCIGIAAMRRRFYWLPGHKAPYINGRISTQGLEHRKYSAVVDIVCQDGLEWVKVSTIQEKRIIWDLAKAGWVGSDSSEEVEEQSDDEEPKGLLRQVEALVKASQATRVKYRHPKIRLVLTRISSRPETKEVAQILQRIRNMGVIMQTSDELREAPPVVDVLDCLTTDRCQSMSDVLNVDCTILLAFASDLSHGQVEPQHWHNRMISKQRGLEAREPLLPSHLWPACGSRKLVCTREAAIRMQEIADTIGTESEKRRTALLLASDSGAGLTKKQTRERFQDLSDYTVPTDWCIPIDIVDVDISILKSTLPPAVNKISESLTEINQAVFLYGWSSGKTTLSSNRAVAKEIESTIEENRTSDEDSGPDIWLCSSRSLVGKEKQRRGKEETP